MIVPLVLAFSAGPLVAGPREDQARKLEKAGEALFQAGKYLNAIKQFQEVVRGFSKPGEVIRTARWNIARCYEELGDDEAALNAFVEFARWAKTADEKRDASEKLKQVRSRLAAKVRFVVKPDGSRLLVDGKVAGKTPFANALELAPGRHTITVTRSGFRPQERPLDLKAKEEREVIITLEAMRGKIEVIARGGKVRQAVVRIDQQVQYRGALPTTLEVPAGRRKVSVTVPGTADRKDISVDVPDKGKVAVVLKVRPSPRKSAPLPPVEEKKEKEAAVTGQVALSLGEGFLHEDGTTERTHVTLELLGGMRFRGARWLQVELGLAMTVESPVIVLLRPGLRFYTGDVPVYFRVAAQLGVRVTSSLVGGILLGAGGEIPLGKGWSLPLGIDINLWPSAISIVPVEFKVGVAYAF